MKLQNFSVATHSRRSGV